MTSQPRRAGRPGAISSIGLTGAPSTASPVAPAVPQQQNPEPAAPPVAEAIVTPRRRDVTSPSPASTRIRPGSPPKATADTTVSYTLRLDQRESMDIDRLGIDLRYETGRRTLDRSEVIRTLLRLASTDPKVREVLVAELIARDVTTS